MKKKIIIIIMIKKIKFELTIYIKYFYFLNLKYLIFNFIIFFKISLMKIKKKLFYHIINEKNFLLHLTINITNLNVSIK